MAERAVPRVTRLLGIINYLDRNGETPFADLASHFGVSEQQVKRDVTTLWLTGLPGYMPNDLIDFDADLYEAGIAHITASQGVTQVRLSAREGIALLGALSSFEASGAAPAVVASAIKKLANAIGDSALAPVTPAAVDPEVVATLHRAIARRVTAKVAYVDALDRRTERAVEPHRIVAIADIAYLECYCHKAQDYRTLRVDRIAAATDLETPIVKPAAENAGFSLVAAYEATVAAAHGGRRVFEDLPGALVTTTGDEVVARFGVVDEDFVAGRLLAIAPYLRRVEPQSLRKALQRKATAILDSEA